MKKSKTRKKNGKIKSWRCHLRCEFTKPNDTNKYIERVSVAIHVPNLRDAKDNEDLYKAVDDWVSDTRDENGYDSKVELSVERWEAIR